MSKMCKATISLGMKRNAIMACYRIFKRLRLALVAQHASRQKKINAIFLNAIATNQKRENGAINNTVRDPKRETSYTNGHRHSFTRLHEAAIAKLISLVLCLRLNEVRQPMMLTQANVGLVPFPACHREATSRVENTTRTFVPSNVRSSINRPCRRGARHRQSKTSV